MKNSIIIILYFIVNTVVAQNTNVICTYKIIPKKENLEIKPTDKNIDIRAKNMLIQALDIAQNFEISLEFNQFESSSQIKEVMINEGIKNSNLYPLSISLIGKGIYYQNLKEKIGLRQVETLGTLYLIKSDLINDWEITNEQKKIGNYSCYKAIRKCSTCNKSDIVWFVPQIPFSFGPLGYGGLPGLVLEVDERTFIIQLTNLQYSKKNLTIIKPSKGIQMTAEEYTEMGNSFRKDAKKSQ